MLRLAFQLVPDIFANLMNIWGFAWRRILIAQIPIIVALLLLGVAGADTLSELKRDLNAASDALSQATSNLRKDPGIPTAENGGDMGPGTATSPAADAPVDAEVIADEQDERRKAVQKQRQLSSAASRSMARTQMWMMLFSLAMTVVAIPAFMATVRVATSSVESVPAAWLASICAVPRAWCQMLVINIPLAIVRSITSAAVGRVMWMLVFSNVFAIIACVVNAITALALVAIALGDRRWLPGTAWTALKTNLYEGAPALAVMTIGVGLFQLPLVYTGWKLLGGPGAFCAPLVAFGLGFAVAPTVALAFWGALEQDLEMDTKSSVPFPIMIHADPEPPPQTRNVASFLEPADEPAPAAGAPAVIPVPAHSPGAYAAPPTQLQPAAGPEIAGVIEPGETIGEWVCLVTAGRVGVTLRWDGAEPPDVQICNQSNEWTPLGTPPSQGAMLETDAAAGWVWIAVTNRAPTAVGVRAQTQLPPQQLAA